MEHQDGNRCAPRPPKLAGGWPLLGHMKALLKDPVELFLRGFREHGPVFRCKLGNKDYVIIAGRAANVWLTRHERDYLSARGFYSALTGLFGCDPNIIMPNVDGPQHKRLRAQMKDGMSRGFLGRRIEAAQRVSRDYMNLLRRQSGSKPIDANKMAKLLVFHQLGETLAGAAAEEYYDDYQHILDVVIRTVVLPWTRNLPQSPRTRRAVKRLDEYGQTIRARVRQGVGPRMLIHDLFSGVDDGLYHPDDLRMLLTVPYLSGLDTLAHSMAFAAYCIVRHPEVHCKVRVELETYDPDTAGLEELKRLVYIRKTAMESMRLYPMSPGQRRRVARDFVLNGYQMHKGDEVIIPHVLSHFQEDVFPLPTRFDPERFGAARGEHKQPGAYKPYGVGPHVCLGAGMADLLLLMNTANLFKRFDVRIADDYRLAIKWFPTAHPVDMKLNLTPREHQYRAPSRGQAGMNLTGAPGDL